MRGRRLAIGFALAAVGCGALGVGYGQTFASPRQTQDIRVNDNVVFLPSVRISVAPDESSVPIAAEVGIAGGRGTGGQRVEAGQLPVVFGGQVFAGPQDLRYAFDFQSVEILMRGGRYFGPDQRFSLEAMAGLGYTSLELKAVGATQNAAEHLSGGGIVAGGVATWNINSATSLRTRVVFSDYGWGGNARITASDRIEIELAQKLGKHLALRAGYAYWRIASERESKDRGVVKSPIYVSPRGPSLSVDLLF